jgi:hypothetical protein
MKTRVLLLSLLAAALTQAAAPANAVDIEFKLPDAGLGVIEVDGPYDGPYDKIVTETMNYVVQVRGDKPNGATDGKLVLRLQGGQDKEFGPISQQWKDYKLSAPYHDLRANTNVFAPTNIPASQLCNDRLNATSGATRRQFLHKGETFKHEGGYWYLNGHVKWLVQDASGKHWTDKFRIDNVIPVKVHCRGLNRVFDKMTFRIEPAQVKQVGQYLCPMELNLHGYVEARAKFYGKSIFIAPHYLSALETLNFSYAGSRNVTAT